MMIDSPCAVTVYRGPQYHPRREPCGKPSKGYIGDVPMCGVHLRAANKAAAKEVEDGVLRERIAVVNERLGLHIFSTGGLHVPGLVAVELSQLEALADRLVKTLDNRDGAGT